MSRNFLLVAGLAAVLLAGSGGARAQDARPAEVSPEMAQALLRAAIAQRDQALNDGICLSVQLASARAKIARLREALKAAPPL